MADQEVEVERLAVTVLESGSDRDRQQRVMIEFVAVKASGRETWKVTIPGAVIEAVRELMQQYEYSLSEPGPVKDLVAENPFTVRVQR